ncbi:hypothetical protein QVD17_17495 [Tagetes erecta]|uniref:Uncharacterized protein n=1 Tax=Tagetes erecta TaxID=13708 RepID=A0AAD8P1K3_TARER|nr:hypothetical protein QVD17_17495 [Tagetes erecta]
MRVTIYFYKQVIGRNLETSYGFNTKYKTAPPTYQTPNHQPYPLLTLFTSKHNTTKILSISTNTKLTL